MDDLGEGASGQIQKQQLSPFPIQLPSDERVSTTHCRLSNVTFSSRARRYRNTSEHVWLYDGVQGKCVCVECRCATKRPSYTI